MGRRKWRFNNWRCCDSWQGWAPRRSAGLLDASRSLPPFNSCQLRELGDAAQPAQYIPNCLASNWWSATHFVPNGIKHDSVGFMPWENRAHLDESKSTTESLREWEDSVSFQRQCFRVRYELKGWDQVTWKTSPLLPNVEQLVAPCSNWIAGICSSGSHINSPRVISLTYGAGDDQSWNLDANWSAASHTMLRPAIRLALACAIERSFRSFFGAYILGRLQQKSWHSKLRAISSLIEPWGDFTFRTLNVQDYWLLVLTTLTNHTLIFKLRL